MTVTLALDYESMIKDVFGGDPTMNVECMVEHCLKQAAGCIFDNNCRAASLCAKDCMENLWDRDNTTEKVHVQNCTNTCAFTYMGKPYEDFMNCVSGHKCISFPPIPSHCKGPDNVTLLKKLSTEDLNGSWWVIKGMHPVYDCYPCQHLTFTRINSEYWNYVPQYQVYLENGSLALYADSYDKFPNTSPGETISFLYGDVGLLHHEIWWLVDAADDKSYIVMYYCGNALDWYYDGALVMARNKSLPDSDTATIADSYRRSVGLDYSKFCSLKTYGCPEKSN